MEVCIQPTLDLWFIFLPSVTNWVLPIWRSWLQKLGFKNNSWIDPVYFRDQCLWPVAFIVFKVSVIVIILSIVSFFNPRPCRERYTVSPTKQKLLNFVIYRCHTMLRYGPFFRSFVNLTRNIICIRHWKFKQTFELYIHVKLERERLPI